MTKTPWEARLGLLLRDPEHFAWAYKPADSKMYGGQARIDWLAADWLGRFWMVEVKSMPSDRASINLLTEVSPGQRDALDSLAATAFGVALLAVGRDDVLYVFEWRRLRWYWQQRATLGVEKPELQLLSDAPLTLTWTGPKGWATLPFHDEVALLRRLDPGAATRPTHLRPAKPSPKRAAPASTLKPADSTPTPDRTLRLVR